MIDKKIDTLKLFFTKNRDNISLIELMVTNHQQDDIDKFFQLLEFIMPYIHANSMDWYTNIPPIMYAAINTNNKEIIEQLLRWFPEFKDSVIPPYVNFPAYAIKHRRNETLKCMLECGVSPDSWDEAPISKAPIEYAVDVDNLEAIIILLSYGAESKVAKAIMEAMAKRKLHIAKAIMMNLEPEIINEIRGELLNCLHEAIEARCMDVVMELCSIGIGINEVDGNGKRPLDYAESEYVIQKLKTMGAVSSTKELYMISELYRNANEMDEDDAIKLIRQISDIKQVVMEANYSDLMERLALNGEIKVMKELIYRGLDCSMLDGKIYYDIFLSIYFNEWCYGNIDKRLHELHNFAKFMMKRGIPVHSADGSSAIHALCELPESITSDEANQKVIIEVLDYFTNRGCDLNQIQVLKHGKVVYQKEWPLTLALKSNNMCCLDYYVLKNASIPDDIDFTKICYSLLSRRHDIKREVMTKATLINKLASIGFNISEQGEDGRTYLHHLCSMAVEWNLNWLRMIPFLLGHGAARDIKDDYGKTPYTCFRLWGYEECLSVVEEITMSTNGINNFLKVICEKLESGEGHISCGELVVFLKLANFWEDDLTDEDSDIYKEILYKVQLRMHINKKMEFDTMQIGLLKRICQFWSE